MSKREWGEGTVFYRRDRGRWMGEWTVHDGSATRQRKTVTLRAKTEAAAIRELRQRRSTSDAQPASDERLRVDAFLERWLTDVSATLKARTSDYYRSVVVTHLAPRLGGHRLKDLRSSHIVEYRNDRLADGLAPRTVSHHLAVLRTALTQAEREGLVPRNEAKLVAGPRIPRRDVRTLSLTQALALLDVARDDPMEAVYALAALTGMRQGEILGLRWNDVRGSGEVPGEARRGAAVGVGSAGRVMDGGRPDADGGVPAAGLRLEIRASLVWLNGAAILDDAKTTGSHRTLTLPSRAAQALERRQAAQAADRAASRRWNKAWDKGYDLVFTDPDGYAVERTSITRGLYRHLEAAGLPRVTFHQLRHGYVGIMRELGMSTDEVSPILGHASANETRETYLHLEEHGSARAAALIDGMTA